MCMYLFVYAGKQCANFNVLWRVAFAAHIYVLEFTFSPVIIFILSDCLFCFHLKIILHCLYYKFILLPLGSAPFPADALKRFGHTTLGDCKIFSSYTGSNNVFRHIKVTIKRTLWLLVLLYINTNKKKVQKKISATTKIKLET